MLFDLIGVILDQVRLIPDDLGLLVGLFSINSLLVLPLDPFFPFNIVNLHIVFNPL